MPCPEPLYKKSSVLGLRKITVIIKAVVEAVKLPCIVAAFTVSVAHLLRTCAISHLTENISVSD
jgi:hypothetical protein